jgi:hypothetical protein
LYTVGRNFGKIFATPGGEILEWLTSDSITATCACSYRVVQWETAS